MPRRCLTLVFLSAGVLAGCGGGDASPASEAGATTVDAEEGGGPRGFAVEEEAVEEPAFGEPGSSSPGSAGEESVVLAVEGEGLRFFGMDSGRAHPIPFGSERGMVREAVTRAQGGPPAEEGENRDCALAFASWSDGLTLFFRMRGAGAGASADPPFVGWALRAGVGVPSADASAIPGPVPGSPTTTSGIGIGSTRTELEEVHAVTVRPSSLGVEFLVGEMAGVFESEEPDARIQAMWAGESCLAR